MEEHPETAERLGDVPVAVLEKGKAPGSHLLSGAVVNPRGLQRLFKDRKRMDELPFYGEVEAESVLFLTKRQALRIPTPPTMVNDRNYVASLSQLARFLAEEAEALGATILPETSADKLLVDGGRVLGVRTGDRGRGRNGEELVELRARLGHHRARHDPLRGHAGPPDRRGARPVRAAQRATRRCGRSASRRSGRSRSRSTA